MAVCDSIPSPESFAPSVLRFLDCQAQLIGAEGYRALAAPGSTASVLLTGMITLLIAFFGYRMLLGHTPTVREGVLTFVKIGLVLVLATKIGRASCRERVCQSGVDLGGRRIIKKKRKQNKRYNSEVIHTRRHKC